MRLQIPIMAATAVGVTAVGVKGSDVYTPDGVGDPRVVLSVKAVRGASGEDLVLWHDKVFALGSDEALQDAVLLTFQNRDVRGGKGERAIFQTLFANLFAHRPTLAAALVDLVPEYGSWGDLVKLAAATPALRQEVFKAFEKQILADEAAVRAEKPGDVSLAAKWAPREGNAHNELAAGLAAHLARPLPPMKASGQRALYRKRIADLNRVIKTTEIYECAGRWDEIDPKRVPARARTIKMSAYLNEKVRTKEEKDAHQAPTLRHPDNAKRMACRANFKAFLAAAAAGKVKISGAETLYPHDVVRRLTEDGPTEDEKNNLNAVWLQMLAKAADSKLQDCIAMCDFSGSMMTDSKNSPYWVSKALGLLIASATSGPFKNKFLGFSSHPEWVSFDSAAPLSETLATLNMSKCQGMSTDFQKAMDQVLATLKSARVPPGQEPKNLVVITDMGWDQACSSSQQSLYTGHSYRHHVKTAPWQTHLEAIRESFKRAGEDLFGEGQGWQPPRIVVWNVAASYTDDFHAQADTEGVIMLAGWSPSLFKILCEDGPRAITPYDALRAQLDANRYDPVRQRVQEWIAGGWRNA